MIARFLALALLLLIGPAQAQTFNPWSAQLIAPRGVDGNLIGFSQTKVTIGAGQFTFDVQPNGQFFPIQGQLLITSLASPTNKMLGQIVAYCDPAVQGAGTCGVSVPHSKVIVSVTPNEVFGAGTFNGWQLYLTPRPQTRLSLYQLYGLQVTGGGSGLACALSGAARDSTDTIDLTLPAVTCVDLTTTAAVQKALAGTLSSSGATATGSGSAFATDFCNTGTPACTNADFNTQLQVFFNSNGPMKPRPIISTASQSAVVDSVSSNTSLTTDTNLGAGAGTSYFRGGPVNHNNTNAAQPFLFFIVLAQKASDGTTALFASSATPSGTPDLPAGYTYYRTIDAETIYWNGSSYTTVDFQPMLGVPPPLSMLYSPGNVLTVVVPPAPFVTGLGLSYNVAAWGQVDLSSTNSVKNTLGVTNGGSGTAGCTLVSALPGSPVKGMRGCVTDAMACTFLGAIAGSGATFCPVIYNGAAWIGGALDDPIPANDNDLIERMAA